MRCGFSMKLTTPTVKPVGAAARCDLLRLIAKIRIKRSQPRCTRQLLQENAVWLFDEANDANRKTCRSCGTLRSFDVDSKNQDQEIAASLHSTAPTGECGVAFR